MATSPSPGTGAKQLIRQGVDWLNIDELDQADDVLRCALTLEPDNADANHLLAIAMLRKDQHLDLAISHIERALEIVPRQPLYINSLGTAYWQAGRLQEARDQFEGLIAIQPDYVEAHYNLANTFRSLQEYDLAIVNYCKTIDLDPGFTDAYNDLGLIWHGRQQFDLAVEQFELAIEVDPSRYQFYVNLSGSLQSLRELDRALVAIQNAISLSPEDGKLLNNLGTIYLDQGNQGEAKRAFTSAIELLPEYPIPAFNLGYVQFLEEDYQASLSSFDLALGINPKWSSAWINRSNTLYVLDRYEEAIAGYKKALEIDPNIAVAHKNLGSAYRRLGAPQCAISHFSKALVIQPDHAKSHLGLAMAYLKSGELSKAWRHYEWRFEATHANFGANFDLNRPLWRGEPLAEKTLLIIGEQGAGDLIQFVRYSEQVSALGAKLKLICAPELVRLMQRTGTFDSVHDRSGQWPQDYDYYIPLLSLPGLFETTLESIPGTVPYLLHDAARGNYWKNRIGRDSISIGLIWSGNPEQLENTYRSCPLSQLQPLLEIEDVTFYSIQKGAGAAEIHDLPDPGKITDYTDELRDFAETADLISALDLIISIDTSTAHLAGALGKPVWTLLWHAHCWRYLTGRRDSPWYPGMRLFRQPQLGDWKSVVQEVGRDLNEFRLKA